MTGFTSNIDVVIERMKNASAQAKNVDVSEALLVGVNAARGIMTFRIFNKGLDAQEETLGVYTGKKVKPSKFREQQLFKGKKKAFYSSKEEFSEYELVRIKAGSQVRYKDEELTGTLRRGVVSVRVDENKVVCSIPNDILYKIARGQEDQVGRIRGTGPAVIFALSEKEREILKLNCTEALKQIYVRIFNS